MDYQAGFAENRRFAQAGSAIIVLNGWKKASSRGAFFYDNVMGIFLPGTGIWVFGFELFI
ncbi:MAG: hypothetical protein HPY50_08430 [Firmicutes bacterium]|nr:hypothetical protein [Bacillota bacterium]